MVPPGLVQLQRGDIESIRILLVIEYDVQRVERDLITRLTFIADIARGIRAESYFLIRHPKGTSLNKKFSHSSKRARIRQATKKAARCISLVEQPLAAILLI